MSVTVFLCLYGYGFLRQG